MESIVVGLIVLAALAYLGRYAGRMLRGTGGGCGCGASGGCPKGRTAPGPR